MSQPPQKPGMDHVTTQKIKKALEGKRALCAYIRQDGVGEVSWSCGIQEMTYLRAVLDKIIYELMAGKIGLDGKPIDIELDLPEVHN